MKHRNEKCHILCGRTKRDFLKEDPEGRGDLFGGPSWGWHIPGGRHIQDKDTRAGGLSNEEWFGVAETDYERGKTGIWVGRGIWGQMVKCFRSKIWNLFQKEQKERNTIRTAYVWKMNWRVRGSWELQWCRKELMLSTTKAVKRKKWYVRSNRERMFFGSDSLLHMGIRVRNEWSWLWTS